MISREPQSVTKVVDALVLNERFYQTISFIDYTLLLFKRHKIPHPTPESMLFVVEERLEGFKYNICLGKGGSTKGEGTKICPLPKKGTFSTLLSLFAV